MKLRAASLWTQLMQHGVIKKQLAYIVSTSSPASAKLSNELPSKSHSKVAQAWSNLPNAQVTQHLIPGPINSSPSIGATQNRFFHIPNTESIEDDKLHRYSLSKLGQWIANAVILATVIFLGTTRANCKALKPAANGSTCNCLGSCTNSKLHLKQKSANPEEYGLHSQNNANLNSSCSQPNPPQKVTSLLNCSPCTASSESVNTHYDSDVDYYPAVQLDGTSLENLQHHDDLNAARKEALALLRHTLTVTGTPGLSVAVAVDGVLIWCTGVGPCNIETGESCYSDSLYRIASISKPLTATLAMALVEDGLLDLDKPLREYLGDEWPQKMVDGEQVDITARQLLSHTSGLRHYHLARPKRSPQDANDTSKTGADATNTRSDNNTEAKHPFRSFEEVEKLLSLSPSSLTSEEFDAYVIERRRRLSSKLNSKPFRDWRKEFKRKQQQKSELFEYYINQQCSSVKEAVKLFKDDNLFFKPGTDFLYSSHGYTLLSRVLEVVTGRSFPELAASLFQDLGMEATTLDHPEEVLYARVPMYERDERHVLRNVPYVDNSYKWAGGGFLSTAVDLTTFGTAMLYSFQNTNHHTVSATHHAIPGYLRSSTMRQMWSPHWFQPQGQAMVGGQIKGYGLGWFLRIPRPDYKVAYHGCRNLWRTKSVEESDSTNEDEEQTSPPSSPPPSPDVGAAANGFDETEHDAAGRGRVAVECSASPTNVSSERRTLDAVKVSQAQFGFDSAEEDDTCNCSDSFSLLNGRFNCHGGPATCTAATVSNDVNNNVGDTAGSLQQSSHFAPGIGHYHYEPEWTNDTKVAGRSHRGYSYCPGFMAYHTGAAVGGSSVLLIAPRLCATWRIERLDEEGAVGRGDLEQNEAMSEMVLELRSEATSTDKLTDERKADNDSEIRKKNDSKTATGQDGKQEKKMKVHRRALLREPTIVDCPVCRKKYKPRCPPAMGDRETSASPSGGVVVAILSNNTGINFTKDAIKIAEIFRKFRSSKSFAAHNMPINYE